MTNNFEIGQLSDTHYIGLHADELPFYDVLKKRLKTIVYEGDEFHIFHYVVTLFDEHEYKFSKDFKIAQWINEIKDKITQLIVFQTAYLEKISIFNSEANKYKSNAGDNKFHFNDNYFIFITEAETIILKTSSILDVAVQFFSRMSGNYIDSYGKWSSVNSDGEFVHDVDKKMQNLSTAFSTLILNHKINNKIKHHESLKLYPLLTLNGWSVCLTGTACESKLLLLDKYIESVTHELVQFLVALNERIKEKF